MTHDTAQSTKPRVVLLGLGAMGAALGRAWLAAGYPVTVWNRTAARAEPLRALGADVAGTAAEAVAAGPLVVTCLLDDASVEEALAGADLHGRDLVDLTTGTPDQADARAAWAQNRGARFLSGGVMAVPPMVGVPEAGGYVFYGGSRAVFDRHRSALAAPLGVHFAGARPGAAALYDIALLSAMNGMLAGITHAFALVRGEEMPLKEFAGLLTSWLSAMASAADTMAEQIDSGDYTRDVVSNLAMQVSGNRTLAAAARERGVDFRLLAPYSELLAERLAQGFADEDGTGALELLVERS
ncbi:dehydrogenase [Nocardiopsis terrae]|uniref:3-hydroxyisobutyrate dehydrogenase-like beta-hydroxyacid dehydrogenase n=1 Tax=Nocardiopsis terrae TaxID=372655 RepID=A0ABR9HC07_9ACTN|nr:NAD(P)-binding domain-containing protein [Nocardiopsis terrae]MBE1456556.1 3-hydroxyisobutyrate dehydrogenase-like beta-hydroxyacid dehydrogenase [Nocardiopsis terrae]GHC76228.1 dehydrogenase [Nocardiopsis terrae]